MTSTFQTTGLLGHVGGSRVVINGNNAVVSFNNASNPGVPLPSMHLEVAGQGGTAGSVQPIGVEEDWDSEQVAIETIMAVRNSANIDPSYFLDGQDPAITARLGFLGAEIGDFRGVPNPPWRSLNTEGRTADSTHIAVGLQVWDEVSDFLSPLALTFVPPVQIILDGIATKMADAINTALPLYLIHI